MSTGENETAGRKPPAVRNQAQPKPLSTPFDKPFDAENLKGHRLCRWDTHWYTVDPQGDQKRADIGAAYFAEQPLEGPNWRCLAFIVESSVEGTQRLRPGEKDLAKTVWLGPVGPNATQGVEQHRNAKRGDAMPKFKGPVDADTARLLQSELVAMRYFFEGPPKINLARNRTPKAFPTSLEAMLFPEEESGMHRYLDINHAAVGHRTMTVTGPDGKTWEKQVSVLEPRLEGRECMEGIGCIRCEADFEAVDGQGRASRWTEGLDVLLLDKQPCQHIDEDEDSNDD